MKKFFCVFLAVIVLCLSFPVIASADLVDASAFAIDNVLQYCNTLINQYQSSINKEIVAARTFYFYCILNDYYSSGLAVFDETGHKFSNDILEFYYTQYANTKKSYISGIFGGSGTSNDIYNSDGDVFMQAAGSSSPWSLSKCSFGVSVDTPKVGFFGDWDKPYFKQYYNTELARFLLESGQSVSDPAPGKNGLEIAPAYVTSDELVDGIERDNKMFFPKNYDSKISYRTDEYFQRRQANNPSSKDYYSPFIVNNSLFVGTNNAQKTYFVYFYELDGKKYYSENVFCLYFDVTEAFDENGNFVRYNKTLNLKLWSGIDGTEDESLVFYQGTSDISDYKYIFLDTAGSSSSYFRLCCYKSLTDYLTKKTDYEALSKQYYHPTHTKLYSPDLIFENGFNTIVNGSSTHKFTGSYDYHTTQYSEYCHNNCDVGILVSDNPIEYTYRSIDTSKIGRGQIVTINGGDTIYNYTITNPETGDSSKFGDYITNNYTYITNNNGGSSGGSVGGDVTVGGKIDVGGSVGVDVNVNVNGGGNSSLPDVDIANNLPEAPQGFIDYLTSLFSFLPAPVLLLILGGISAAIFCRVWGR